MTTLFVLAIVAVAIVIVFDFTNGFHDASNVVATVIASNAMTPRQAVVIVGTFHFLGPVLGGTAVANTIGGFVKLEDQDPATALIIVLSGLSGAIFWNLLTWWKGLPSSSSHALVGALAGVVVVAVGADHVVWGFSELMHGRVKGVMKVVLGLLVSPVLGFLFAFVLHRIIRRQMNRATPKANTKLRYAQFGTAALLSFTHGANDAQKSMGILTLILVLGGFIGSFEVPYWVILVCAAAITVGTVLGGWRIVKTLGFAIFKVRPLHAFNSQLASATIIFAASVVGAPVSTTHVVSTSILGVGASERPKSVHWEKAREIALTWIITIPGAALMAIVFFAIASGIVRLASH